ncbi:Crp/Fnr family transcriptional regulator [Loigolactobacillus jiayinensis]|uniref:Crp/Fnr family transcriptional regulator n=1 Tax=Loigolactobacillus jiayinensis TaxID=2486016 RepID=A0ABW1RFE8_9LACO|nr:Crp/Fnr family transcriptional regulator [Loigolactobacillus jiayinensis]
MQQFTSILLTSVLFNGVTKAQLAPLLTAATPTQKVFAAGKRIWQAGEKVTTFGLVCAGQVQIVKENVQGNRMIVATIKPGDIFGEAYIYAATGGLPVSVDASQAAIILFFTPQRLLLLTQLPSGQQVVSNLLQILAQKSLLLNQKVEILGQRRIADKVLTYLRWEQRRQQTNPILLPYNRQEMADFLGVERSALSATLSEMKQATVIDYHKNQFTLL